MLLIPRFQAKFANFGQHSTISGSNLKAPLFFCRANGGNALGSNFFREVNDLRWMESATVRQISGKSNSDATDIEGIGCQRLLPSAHITTPTGQLPIIPV